MASWQGEFQHKNGRRMVFTPSLLQNPAVIKNGEIYAKVKNINIVSGYSDQHGYLAGV
jgi:hypothetical protein